MNFKLIFLLLVLVGSIFSCTVEKRIYSSGYHVEWNKKFKSSKNETNLITHNEVRTAETHLVPFEFNQSDFVSEEKGKIEFKDDFTEMVTAENEIISVDVDKRENTSRVDQSTKEVNNSELNESQSPQKPDLGIGSLVGFILMIVAILLILLAILFYAIFPFIGWLISLILSLAAVVVLVLALLFMLLP